jgi:hypothetical protein
LQSKPRRAKARKSNIGLPVNWIAADVVRLKGRNFVEHSDVIQDEATEQQSKSGESDVRQLLPKVDTSETSLEAEHALLHRNLS